ncbi:MAG: PUR family DNA/RNA-binding protein [Rectinema sp.]|nr:PUR family DNA/RNA-binding protein [Rectinema sp.]
MGIRGELFSTRFSAEGRTYFFNVKENRNGDIFLTVVESKPTESETFDRRSIVVFKENLEGFMKSLRTAVGYMEKAGQNQSRRPPHPRGQDHSSVPHEERSFEGRNAEKRTPRIASSEGRPPRRIVIRKKPHSSGESKSESDS